MSESAGGPIGSIATGGVGRGDFEDLQDYWKRALGSIEEGHLEEAEEILTGALERARQQGDEQRVDALTCGMANLATHMGRGESELPRLREILVRNRDAANCRLAAYTISIYYQFAKNFKKSTFYARIARDRARQLGRRDWIASSHNQLGNALLGESQIEEACAEYELGLATMPEELAVWRAAILNNLGYCRILQKRYRDGYTLLYQSLRSLRRRHVLRYQLYPLLDLSFAHLETGRYRYAERHGRAALRLAESLQDASSVKNALYLLGEVANLQGDREKAYDYFSRLQQDFFPGSDYLVKFLLMVDVRGFVNLHA